MKRGFSFKQMIRGNQKKASPVKATKTAPDEEFDEFAADFEDDDEPKQSKGFSFKNVKNKLFAATIGRKN